MSTLKGSSRFCCPEGEIDGLESALVQPGDDTELFSTTEPWTDPVGDAGLILGLCLNRFIATVLRVVAPARC